MYCVRLIAAVAVVALGAPLAGCSGFSITMPDWMSVKTPPPPNQALRFESTPAGAEVKTAQGETCRTPCSLAVPLASQQVTFSMNGYAPQTVPVEVKTTERAAFDSSVPAADFSPNPVEVALEVAPKKPGSKSKTKPKPHTAANAPASAAETRTASRSVAPEAAAGSPQGAVGSPGSSAFPALSSPQPR